MNKQERLEAANEFIKVIASCGRNFLSSNSDIRNKEAKPFVSFMEIDKRGRVWFTDYYTKKRIYTHYDGRWRGFTSGGTLKMIVESMRDFITKGSTMRAGYFQPEMDNGFGNPWGYGEDILIVKDAAIKLGLAT